MKKVATALSLRIKGLREQAGMSQQELAQRAALSVSQVAKLEQGIKADPRASTLLALAGALGVRPGELLDELLPAGADARDKLSKEEKREWKRRAREVKKEAKAARKQVKGRAAERDGRPVTEQVRSG